MSIPALVIVFCSYVYFKVDPFEDFGCHKNYSWKYFYQSLGDVSTKKLLNSTVNYNSFVFGSSRTVSFYACYAQSRIKNSKFFHYGNWTESIGGIAAKLILLDSLGYSLDNVFIYIDTDNTFKDDGRCHPDDHYLLTGKNRNAYYYSHFRSFIPPNVKKMKILLGYHIDPESFPNWESDLITNDSKHTCSDSIINNYGVPRFDAEYIAKIDSMKKSGFLYVRSKFQKFKESQISNSETALLMKVKSILDKHKSRYTVIITPLYDQMRFSRFDFDIIKEIFKDRLFDFSGINEFTNNEYNYSDRIHFLPYISKQIIDSACGTYPSSLINN